MVLKNERNLQVLAELAATVAARKGTDPSTSYTASLLSQGVAQCAKKFGEEATELILAAVAPDKVHTAAEAADVLYHLFVLLEATDVELDDVLANLKERQAMSGHDEKTSRSS